MIYGVIAKIKYPIILIFVKNLGKEIEEISSSGVVSTLTKQVALGVNVGSYKCYVSKAGTNSFLFFLTF